MLNVTKLLKKAPLGDKRRNRRAIKLVKSHLQHRGGPGGVGRSKNKQAAWADEMGKYRFLDNPRVRLPALYEPVHRGLDELVPKGERAYVIHDLSVLDYSRHDRKEDLIPVGNSRGYGYELYTALVLGKDGGPRGPVQVELRTTAGLLSSEDKEPVSYQGHHEQVERGILSAEKVLPERDLVHVADREFDDLQLMRQLSLRKMLIRAQHLSRKVKVGGRETKLSKVVDALSLQPLGTVRRREKKQVVTYRMYAAQTEVELYAPSLRGVAKQGAAPQAGPPIRVRVVVTELRAKDKKPLRWVLLTNLDDPLPDVVQIYVWRWRVERLFFLVKHGWKLSDWHEENGERISKRLGLVNLSAMLIYQLQAAEGNPAYQELLERIALMGGWLGRKRDPIGPIVLMRGMFALLMTLDAVQLYGEKKLRKMAKTLQEEWGIPVGDDWDV